MLGIAFSTQEGRGHNAWFSDQKKGMRPSAIESPSKIKCSDSGKTSKFLYWCERQRVEVAKSDALRHERRWVPYSTAGKIHKVRQVTPHTHRLSCLRVSDFETSTLCNSHHFRNFEFFSESLKITFEGLSIALGLAVIFFLIHYVHALSLYCNS